MHFLGFERESQEDGKDGSSCGGAIFGHLSMVAPLTVQTLSGRRQYLNIALQTLKQYVWLTGSSSDCTYGC